MKPNQQTAIHLMKANPNARLYEAGDSTGKHGSGRWYISGTSGTGPMLTTEDVMGLATDGLIALDFPGFYRLRDEIQKGTSDER